jgi:hypothetical protein
MKETTISLIRIANECFDAHEQTRKECDRLRKQNAELMSALEMLDTYYASPGIDSWMRFTQEVLKPARAVLAKVRGES